MYFSFTTSCSDGGSTLLILKNKLKHNRTFTTVNEIEDEERIEEVSRMMSGAEITDLTLQHAKELIEMAKNRKQMIN